MRNLDHIRNVLECPELTDAEAAHIAREIETLARLIVAAYRNHHVADASDTDILEEGRSLSIE